MQLEIISPDKTIFSGEATHIQLPGSNGSFGILNHHAPMIATLKKGKIKVENETSDKQFFAISGGVVEVLKNKVIVLVEA